MRATIAVLGVAAGTALVGAMLLAKRAPLAADFLTVVAIGLAVAAAMTPWIAA